MKVTYKEIAGFVGYRVGDDGSVWSRKTRGSGRIAGEWRLMKPNKDAKGYVRYGLMRDGKQVWKKGHTLVLEAFVGPRPEGMECRHLNNVKVDNSLANLKWGTSEENSGDRTDFSTMSRGAGHYLAKLTESDIPEIFRLARAGVTNVAIAAKFGVSQPTVNNVLRRVAWRHVPIEEDRKKHAF